MLIVVVLLVLADVALTGALLWHARHRAAGVSQDELHAHVTRTLLPHVSSEITKLKATFERPSQVPMHHPIHGPVK